MKFYSTVMFAGDLAKSEFFLGEIDASNRIVGFTDFILKQPLPRLLASPSMMYIVQVSEEDGEIADVHVTGWYLTLSKTDPVGRHTVMAMIEHGELDPVESGNKILGLNRHKH